MVMNSKFIIATIIVQLCKSEGLLYGGRNVCSKIEHHAEKYTVIVTKKVPVVKKVKCWDIIAHFKCDKVFNEDRKFEEERTRLVPVRTLFCCSGFTSIDDECKRKPDIPNKWTISTSGCQCYFNPNQDCACCVYGGCQCDQRFPNKCVQCGNGLKCLPIFDYDNYNGIDAWTKSETGCACDGSDGPGDCPCCQHMGCQCKKGNTKRCRQCGLPQSCYDNQGQE